MGRGKLKPLVDECQRQHDSCLYTSTSLFYVIHWHQRVRSVATIVPLVLGSVASLGTLIQSREQWAVILVAAFSLIAGLVPSLMTALKFDENLDRCRTLAGEFKNLQDRFRQAATITVYQGLAALTEEFNVFREKMEELRRNSVIVPDWAFAKAQAKINAGDYKFDVDADKIEDEPEGGTSPTRKTAGQ